MVAHFGFILSLGTLVEEVDRAPHKTIFLRLLALCFLVCTLTCLASYGARYSGNGQPVASLASRTHHQQQTTTTTTTKQQQQQSETTTQMLIAYLVKYWPTALVISLLCYLLFVTRKLQEEVHSQKSEIHVQSVQPGRQNQQLEQLEIQRAELQNLQLELHKQKQEQKQELQKQQQEHQLELQKQKQEQQNLQQELRKQQQEHQNQRLELQNRQMELQNLQLELQSQRRELQNLQVEGRNQQMELRNLVSLKELYCVFFYACLFTVH